MKKKDIIFLVVVFIGLAGIAAGFYLTHQDTGASVEVIVDGAIYGTYPLDVDKEIPIQKDGKTTNLLVIKDGKADVTEADCPDKLCVHQKAISKTNETIVCLPNKVVVQVIGAGEIVGFHCEIRKNSIFRCLPALALICSYVESLIPFYFGIPGVKLGLTNIVVVLMLYCVGTKEALAVSALRIVLSGFLFGNMFSILYSLAGGLLSFLVMYLLKKTKWFGVLPVSVSGGIFHNVGQLVVAAYVVENYNIFYYMPVLLIAGALTGFLVGIAAQEMIKRIGKRMV